MPVDPGPGYPVQPAPRRKPKPKSQGASSGRRRQPTPPGAGVERIHDRPVPAPVKPPPAPVSPQQEHLSLKRRQETIRRQRLLKALNYNVVVDGVWGPRAQRAWSDYQRKRRATLGSVGKGGPKVLGHGEAGTAAIVQADREAKEKAARDAAAKQRAVVKAEILRTARVLHRDPAVARNMPFKALAKVILDPESGLGPTSRAGATVIQEWLIAHRKQAAVSPATRGVPAPRPIAVTGVYDRATHEALGAAFAEEQQRERAVHVRAVLRDVYGPAGLKPGQKADWLPTGIVPKALDLVKLIEAGSFTGAMILERLLKFRLSSQNVFDPMRRAELLARAAQLQPFGKGGQPLWLQKSGGTGGTQLQLYADILGVTDLAPQPDLSAYPEATWATKLARRAENPEIRAENQKRLGRLHSEVLALARSNDGEEFAGKLSTYLNLEERKYQAFQAQLAAESSSWWGDAIDGILAPGKFLRTAAVYDTMRLTRHYSNLLPGPDDAPAVEWEDALTVLGERPEDYHGSAIEASRWLTIPYELIADPVNFAHPFRAGSSFLRYGTKGASLGRYVLKGDDIWTRALTYQKGTWSKAVILGSVDDVVTGGLIRNSDSFKRAAAMASKSVALREEAVASARERISRMTKFGFKTPKVPVNAKGLVEDFDVKQPRSAHTRSLIDDGSKGVRGWLETDEGMSKIVEAFKEEAQSLWVNASRDEYSNVGASLLANLAEKARVQSLHKIATDEAYAVYNDLIHQLPDDLAPAAFRVEQERIAEQAYGRYREAISGAGVFLKGGFLSRGGKLDKDIYTRVEKAVALRLDEIEQTIFPAIQDMLEEAAETAGTSLWDESGLWAARTGTGANTVRALARESFDDLPPAGTIPTEAEIAENGELRFYSFLWKGDGQVIIGAPGEHHWQIFQREGIEDIKSWGQGSGAFEDGKIASMHGSRWDGHSAPEVPLPPKVKKNVKDHFTRRTSTMKSVANPQFDTAFTHAEMTELVEAEVRRRTGRVLQFGARQKAAGLLDDQWDVYAAVERERADVVKWWEKRNGEWFDTREKVQVSDLYTRHLTAAFEPDANGELLFRGRGERVQAEGFAMRLAQLAEAPKFSAGTQTDDALWQMIWSLGGRYKMRLPKGVPSHPTRRYLGPDPGSFDSYEEYLAAIDESFAHADRLSEAVTKHQHGLSRAWDELLPGEMAKEFAVWQALAHAQSWYAKTAYLGLSGALNTWVFATLALRPGWMVRNVIDNTAKLIVQGVRDPRMFFLGGAAPGSGIRSAFDFGLRDIRQMIAWLDSLFGTSALEHWMRLEESIWAAGADVLRSVFNAHGLEDVPQALLDGAQFDPFERVIAVGKPKFDEKRATDLGLVDEPGAVATTRKAAKLRYKKFRDGAFELMGNRPENYFKRVLYRAEIRAERKRLIAGGMTAGAEVDLLAHDHAWAKIEETLFDYSKISVVEDNFRVFFPFIQFWRKNTNFWAHQLVSKPWLPLSIVKIDEARREAHVDLPPWMRRYIHTDEITDAAAVVPGLDVIVKHILPADVQYDPFNLLSIAPLYRSLPKIMDELGELAGVKPGLQDRLKTENPSMPGEREGHAIFGPIIDAVSDWGLGLNPFVRKPLESANIASERAWQSMFPQTPVAVALTREFWGDSAALKVGGWESLWGRLPLGVSSDSIADNFDFYVQQEVANQQSRGETPDIEAAKKVIRHWFLTQNLYGYFTGMYFRRATPEDMLLAKLAELPSKEVPADQRDALKTWRMRGYDRLTFERYVALVPMLEAYYRTNDPAEKARLKREYPGIIQWVDATWRGRPFSGKWTRNAQRYTQQAKFFTALEIVDKLDAPHAVREAALDIFRTPELEAYWNRAGSPKKERERMVKAAAFEYFTDLSNGFHELPEDDFEARNGYLAEHPELVRYWNRNNDESDDYEAIIGGANAALREQYFSIVKAKGFAAAASFLSDFRFMFEGTSAENKIDPATGQWKIGAGKKKFSPERLAAFRKAKPHLTWFFDTYMKKVGSKAAFAWLNSSDSDVAKSILDYLKRYGKHSQKSIDYLRAKPWLAAYFAMSPEARGKWLAGDSEGAKIVKAYFEKYASEKGTTQHGKDYLAVKGQLAHYFSLSKPERRAWLESGTADARAVLAYFKKYGKTHRYEKAFLGKYPQLTDGTPEQRKRLEFWRQYFELTPDKRPAFIIAQAEAHGVFVYGEFGEQEQHDREMEYKRRAVAAGLSDRQTAYLYVRPLLDFYFQLPKEEKALFIRLNPEIHDYLDKYSDGKVTGDKQLDADVEAYFKLPPDSFGRSEWLKQHPKVQDWFDSRSSPAERAMRNLLEQYFNVPLAQRAEFVAKHPEIPAYFEDRRQQRSIEGDIYDAFDHTDPRLRQYFTDANDLIRAAEEMRRKLRLAHLRQYTPDSIESRRDRRPLAA